MQLLVILGSIYLLVDGIASIVAFQKQPFYCQLVRVGRFIIGLVFLLAITPLV